MSSIRGRYLVRVILSRSARVAICADGAVDDLVGAEGAGTVLTQIAVAERQAGFPVVDVDRAGRVPRGRPGACAAALAVDFDSAVAGVHRSSFGRCGNHTVSLTRDPVKEVV